MSVLDTIRAATPTRKAVTMCLDGALQAEWDKAVADLDKTAEQDAKHGSLEGPGPALNAAVDHLESLRDRVQASEVTFLFDAANYAWTEFISLQAEHPPRDGNLLDRIKGFNVETFYPILIRKTCGTVSSANSGPEEMTEDAWVTLLGAGEKRGSLNLNQVNKLIGGADHVMNGETAVPPSARSLLKSQDFGASLALPDPGSSPPSGSEGGSRPTSPSTSTTKKARSKGSSSGQ